MVSEAYEHCVKVNSSPDVYMIRVPFMNISTSETNAYVVLDQGECLVIDTGAPSKEGAALFEAALDELGVDRSRLSFFLTHLHMDHAGLIDEVAPACAPLYLSKTDFDYMLDSSSDRYWEEAEAQVRAEGFSAESIRAFGRYGIGIESFNSEGRDLRFVAQGDEISVGSVTLRVVDTAGHTPGHLSLYHEESGLMFIGDHVLFVISPSLGLRPGIENTMRTYIDNLRKLLSFDISKLMVAHGPLQDGWRERIEWMIGHNRRRIDLAQRYIAEHPQTSGFEVILNLKWNVPFDSWEQIPDGQKWCIIESGIIILHHLVAEGRVLKTLDEQGIYRYSINEAN